MNIQSINVEDLITLAKGTTDKGPEIPELKGYKTLEISNQALREAIERKKSKAEAEAIERAADSLLQLLNNAQVTMHHRLQQLRMVRNQEKALLAQIKQINVAQAYANASNNFLPLLVALGSAPASVALDPEKSSLMDVPQAFIDEYFAEKKAVARARSK